MSTAFLTRKVRFSAAHHYHRPEWSEERNRQVFGRCNIAPGHGHNYLLEVTVAGRIDAETGFAVNLGELDAVLEREVVGPLDHRHLNHAVEAFAYGGAIPTTENILAHLWPRIRAALPDGVRLRRLRLHEEPGFHVDYYGGGGPPGEPADEWAEEEA